MGLKFIGAGIGLAEARIPVRAIFTVSGAASNRRPRRVQVTMQNSHGETINTRVFVPFYLSNSSLARSSANTSALTSGTIAASLPLAITSRGSLEVLVRGKSGILGSNSLGRARLNISNASGTNVGRRHLVLMFSGGENRSVSTRILISS